MSDEKRSNTSGRRSRGSRSSEMSRGRPANYHEESLGNSTTASSQVNSSTGGYPNGMHFGYHIKQLVLISLYL